MGRAFYLGLDDGLVCTERQDFHEASPRRRVAAKGGLAKWAIALLICVTMVLASALTMGLPGPNDSAVRLLAYIPHDPIEINNDLQFAAMAGSEGWPGDGSAAHPYVINGYGIDAKGYDYGIMIGNTTVHYIISNCFIQGAGTANVYLFMAANGALEKNLLSGSQYGIADFASSSICDNNTFSENMFGAFLLMTSGANLDGNSFVGGSVGIMAYYGSYDTIANNSFSNEPMAGIGLYYSSYETLKGNMFSNTSIEIEGEDPYIPTALSYWTTHDIDESNLVNGKPVRYIVDQTGGTAPSDAGQVIVANCVEYVVEEQQISNTAMGIEVAYSALVTVRNNTLTNVTRGVNTLYGGNTTIEDNVFNGCQYGTYLTYADYYSVLRNSYTGCMRGISLDTTSNFLLDNNTFSNSTEAAIFLLWCTYGTLTTNTMTNGGIMFMGDIPEEWTTHEISVSNTVNGKPVAYAKDSSFLMVSAPGYYGQVILANCYSPTVANQIISNATAPVMLAFCPGAVVKLSNLSQSSVAGIYVLYSDGATVQTTDSWGNAYGLLIDSSNDCGVVQSLFRNNTAAGIAIGYSERADIRMNDFVNCGIYLAGDTLAEWNSHSIDTSNWISGRPIYYYKDQTGGSVPADASQVILANCRGMTVADLSLWNATVGVQLGYCSWTNVSGTSCSGNLVGLYETGSDHTTVSSCSFSENMFGIEMEGSVMATVVDSLFVENTAYAIALLFSSDCLVWNNTFWYNNGATNTYDPNHVQAYDTGTNDRWNSTTRGNFWSDWQTPDANGDGIVDVPYEIFAMFGAVDYYPLTTPTQVIPEFGLALTVLGATALIGVAATLRRRGSRQ